MNLETEFGIECADAVGAYVEAIRTQQSLDFGEVGIAHLDDSADFLSEQGREDVVGREARPTGGCGIISGSGFTPDIIVRRLDRYVIRKGERNSDVTSECHFDHGGEQPAIRPVVVGENFLRVAELLDHRPEALEVNRALRVGGGFAHLVDDLCEDRTAETVLAATQIDEDQGGVGLLGELRRE